LILWFGDGPLKSKWVKIAFVVLYLIAANVLPFTKLLAGSYFNVLQSYLLLAACGMFAILVMIKHQFKPEPSI
jgi:carbon starvation protein CstA